MKRTLILMYVVGREEKVNRRMNIWREEREYHNNLKSCHFSRLHLISFFLFLLQDLFFFHTACLALPLFGERKKGFRVCAIRQKCWLRYCSYIQTSHLFSLHTGDSHCLSNVSLFNHLLFLFLFSSSYPLTKTLSTANLLVYFLFVFRNTNFRQAEVKVSRFKMMN